MSWAVAAAAAGILFCSCYLCAVSLYSAFDSLALLQVLPRCSTTAAVLLCYCFSQLGCIRYPISLVPSFVAGAATAAAHPHRPP
jgi:hypothetical protein